MTTNTDRGKHLERLKRQLETELVYRRTHGHEYSPGVIDELRTAIRYVADQIAMARRPTA